MKKIKNISKETQLVDGEEIKAWAVFETRYADSLIRNYPHIYEEVKENEKVEEEKVEEEKVEEEKVEEEKKPAKKSKK